MKNNSFGMPIIPDNEEERLAKLRSLNLLDTYEENGTFKHIAAIASRMFNVPIALVNLVDRDFVVTKAQAGMDGITKVERGISLCSLSILRSEVTVFENAREEPCLLANPMVTGEFGLQFYAAAPLTTKDGFNIGAVCIVDKASRKFPESDQKMLESLAAVVMEEIEK
ncbi:GAF domain-containing protein [Pontibacter aydingkolensis]|uniref:GAF domain-containing protein n=1 Tax=Pontibacter aydingkolensis TaxID=1911536 RepID=A0ABS7CR78_9BACT|nr:GAF domain-containing protein [Pontibacter aydingkolensis]MBW7466357.1 GAF domain-containing protein [Pontibacter aydingkolensis]